MDLNIIAITCTIVMVINALMAYRNSWVFDRQNELNRFDGDVHVIKQYADYDTMMNKFWVWDIEKMKVSNIKGGSAMRICALHLERKVRDGIMEIMQIKINLPVIPDYEMGERQEKFIAAIHAITGCSETMIHSGSWVVFDVDGSTDDECMKDLARIRKDVAKVIRKFKFGINPNA